MIQNALRWVEFQWLVSSRRAKQEIAVVLERVDVLRPAALASAAAWDGRNSRPCRAAGTRSGTAPRIRPPTMRKIATGAPLRAKKPGSAVRRRARARSRSAQRRTAEDDDERPEEDGGDGDGIGHAGASAPPAAARARRRREGQRDLRLPTPARSRPTSRPSDIVSAWPLAARSATWVTAALERGRRSTSALKCRARRRARRVSAPRAG